MPDFTRGLTLGQEGSDYLLCADFAGQQYVVGVAFAVPCDEDGDFAPVSIQAPALQNARLWSQAEHLYDLVKHLHDRMDSDEEIRAYLKFATEAPAILARIDHTAEETERVP